MSKLFTGTASAVFVLYLLPYFELYLYRTHVYLLPLEPVYLENKYRFAKTATTYESTHSSRQITFQTLDLDGKFGGPHH